LLLNDIFDNSTYKPGQRKSECSRAPQLPLPRSVWCILPTLLLQTVGAVTSLDDETLGINLQGLSAFLPIRGKKQQTSPTIKEQTIRPAGAFKDIACKPEFDIVNTKPHRGVSALS
jgi:hypothetical protein